VGEFGEVSHKGDLLYYAGMISDSVYSIAIGSKKYASAGKFNLYFPVNMHTTIMIGGQTIGLCEVNKKSIRYYLK